MHVKQDTPGFRLKLSPRYVPRISPRNTHPEIMAMTNTLFEPDIRPLSPLRKPQATAAHNPIHLLGIPTPPYQNPFLPPSDPGPTPLEQTLDNATGANQEIGDQTLEEGKEVEQEVVDQTLEEAEEVEHEVVGASPEIGKEVEQEIVDETLERGRQVAREAASPPVSRVDPQFAPSAPPPAQSESIPNPKPPRTAQVDPKPNSKPCAPVCVVPVRYENAGGVWRGRSSSPGTPTDALVYTLGSRDMVRPRTAPAALLPVNRSTSLRFRDGQVIATVPMLDTPTLVAPEPGPFFPPEFPTSGTSSPASGTIPAFKGLPRPSSSSPSSPRCKTLGHPVRYPNPNLIPALHASGAIGPHTLRPPHPRQSQNPGSGHHRAHSAPPNPRKASCTLASCVSHQLESGLVGEQKTLGGAGGRSFGANGKSDGKTASTASAFSSGLAGSIAGLGGSAKSLGASMRGLSGSMKKSPSLTGNTWDAKSAETERLESDVPLIRERDIPMYRLDQTSVPRSNGSLTPPDVPAAEMTSTPFVVGPVILVY